MRGNSATWSGFIALGLILISAHAAAINITIGGNYWPSAWDISAFPVLINEGWTYGDVSGEDHWEDATSLDTSGSGLYGINGSISFNGPVGFGFTLLTGSYDFSINQDFQRTFAGDITSRTHYELDFPVDRTDIDIALTYRLTANLSAFLGYKSLRYSYGSQRMLLDQEQFTHYGTLSSEPAEHTLRAYEVNYHGPGIGLSAAYPIGQQGFLTFGALSVLPYFLGDETGSVKRLSDNTGWAVNSEFGFGYIPPALPIFARLSFRYQRFDGFSTAEIDLDENQVFSGALLSLGVRI
jgi:hypothetical protein